MPNVVVLGWRSPLASYIHDTMPESWNVWGGGQDVRYYKDLHVTKASPDVVINCAQQKGDLLAGKWAATTAGFTASQDLLFQTNSVGAGNVALWANAHNALLIHVSCDAVMGAQGPYYDSHIPYPQSDYAYSKYMGELVVKALAKRYTIMRVGWLYGARYLGRPPVVASSRKDAKISDEGRGQPMHARNFAKAILQEIVHKRDPDFEEDNRTLHVGTGKQPQSWYEFLEPYYPHIEPIYKRGKSAIHDVWGLHPSSEHHKWGDGMDVFQAEMKRHPVWRKATKRQ